MNPLYRRMEGNVLFNDALKTFYLRLYGVRHMGKEIWQSLFKATVIWRQIMVKDHSASERRNPLPPHGLLFYIHHPSEGIAHTTAFITPVMEHWLEREIAQWAHNGRGIDPTTHHTMSERLYHGATCTSRSGTYGSFGFITNPLRGNG